MLKRYVIYCAEKDSYYTGIKYYEWSQYIYKAKVFKIKPTVVYLSKICDGRYWLEIRTIYIPKK